MKAIKVPGVFLDLDDAEKKELMNIMGNRAFDWSSRKLIEFMGTPTGKKIKLDQGKNLYKIHTYVSAMQEAVDLEVGEPGDLVPNLARLNAKRAGYLKARREQRDLHGNIARTHRRKNVFTPIKRTFTRTHINTNRPR